MDFLKIHFIMNGISIRELEMALALIFAYICTYAVE